MDEANLICVKGLSAEAKVARLDAAPAVHGVPDDRPATVRQVHAKLVSPAGLWAELHQAELARRLRLVAIGDVLAGIERERAGRRIERLEHLVQRDRRL